MHTCRNVVPVLLVALATATLACETAERASPTSPTAESVVLSAEPSVVVPEMHAAGYMDASVSHGGCATLPGFRTRLTIVLTGRQDLRLRNLRFHFTDRDGRTSVAVINPGASTSGTALPVSMPSSLPIPVPTTLPLPVPGTTTASGGLSGGLEVLVVAGRPYRIPSVLDFGCGMAADGILGVSSDSIGENGAANMGHTSVRVGRY